MALTCDQFFLPQTDFNFCTPDGTLSEIEVLHIAAPDAAPFNNIRVATEWLSRASQITLNNKDTIRSWDVVGDKPAGAPVTKDISRGRKKKYGKDYTINFTIDDVSDKNFLLAQFLQAHETIKLFAWENAGGKMRAYGNTGIIVTVTIDDNEARGRDSGEELTGTLTWRTQLTYDRFDSPIFSGISGGNTTPTLGGSVISVTNITNTSLRVNFTRTGLGVTGASYAVKLFSDAGLTQQVGVTQNITEAQIIGGQDANAFFSQLTAGNNYYPEVTVSAAGYNPATTSAATATTNNMRVIFKALTAAYNSGALPTQTQLEADLNSAANYPLAGPLTIDFQNAGTPAYNTFAFPTVSGFTPSNWVEDQNPSNTGGFGVGETWHIVGVVGPYTIGQSDLTDYANAVIIND